MNTKLCSLKYTPNTAAAVAVKVVRMRFMKNVVTEDIELITMLGMLILEMASIETFDGRAPARVISRFQCLFMKNATIAATICPPTVATAAPAMPISGKPSRPKIRMGSNMMFSMAPMSCVIMESVVRPVDWSMRS